MINFTETTVFNTSAQTVVNTVNCVGVMGAGIALEFRLRYPEMFQDYADRCQKGAVMIGRPYLYRNYEYPWIMNFPTKKHWKNPSRIDWIEDGLKYFAANYKKANISSIAFSQLGCGKGNLDWHEVKPVMEKYLTDIEIPVYICLDTESKASGLEGDMVEIINRFDQIAMTSELSLKPSIATKIITSLPVMRFREIAQIEGVGKQTYEQVFCKIYQIVQEKQQIISTINVVSMKPPSSIIQLDLFL